MFRHVVMFRWNDGVDEHHVDAVRAGLDALPAAIPQIKAYVHGPDAGVNAGNYDYAVTADFESVADYVAYRDHPEHRAFIATLISGHVAERAAVQFHPMR